MLVQCEKGLGDLFVQLLGYAASLSENQFRIFQLPLLIELVIFGGQVRKPSVFKLLEEPQFLVKNKNYILLNTKGPQYRLISFNKTHAKILMNSNVDAFKHL